MFKTLSLSQFIEKYKSQNKEVDIIGLSPSIIAYDRTRDVTRIALNKSWYLIKSDFLITIHPTESLIDFEDYKNLPSVIICGFEKWKNFESTLNSKKNLLLIKELKKRKIILFKYRIQNENFLSFDPSNAGRNLFTINFPKSNFLYMWSSISQPAMHLAYLMNYKKINLIGCEAIDIKGKSHAIGKSRWNGVPANYRLNQYIQGNLDLAYELRKRNVQINTITPYVGLNLYEKQLNSLQKTFNIRVEPNIKYLLSKKEIKNYILYLLAKIFSKAKLLKVISLIRK